MMLVSGLLAIFFTFVNLQNCPNKKRDSEQFKNESFVYMNNLTNLEDRNLKSASKKLDILYFK